MAIQVWVSTEELAATMDAAKEMGATSIRVDFPWQHIEAQRGSYDWATVDRAVRMAKERDLHILAILGYTPNWATNHPGIRHPAPSTQYLPEWKNFVKAVVERHKDYVSDWEIWNEPNITNFWAPYPAAKDYVPFLKSAYTSIKSVQPGDSSNVITAGLAPAANVNNNRSPVTFFEQIYAHGGKGYFDEIAMHPYAYPFDPTDPNRPGNGGQSWIDGWTATLRMKDYATSQGDGDKQFWLSEYGVPTGLNSKASTEQEQSEILGNSWSAVKDLPWVKKTHLYTMIDSGTNKFDLEHNFGLLRRDMSPKPAYETIQQINGCD